MNQPTNSGDSSQQPSRESSEAISKVLSNQPDIKGVRRSPVYKDEGNWEEPIEPSAKSASSADGYNYDYSYSLDEFDGDDLLEDDYYGHDPAQDPTQKPANTGWNWGRNGRAKDEDRAKTTWGGGRVGGNGRGFFGRKNEKANYYTQKYRSWQAQGSYTYTNSWSSWYKGYSSVDSALAAVHRSVQPFVSMPQIKEISISSLNSANRQKSTEEDAEGRADRYEYPVHGRSRESLEGLLPIRLDPILYKELGIEKAQQHYVVDSIAQALEIQSLVKAGRLSLVDLNVLYLAPEHLLDDFTALVTVEAARINGLETLRQEMPGWTERIANFRAAMAYSESSEIMLDEASSEGNSLSAPSSKKNHKQLHRKCVLAFLLLVHDLWRMSSRDPSSPIKPINDTCSPDFYTPALRAESEALSLKVLEMFQASSSWSDPSSGDILLRLRESIHSYLSSALGTLPSALALRLTAESIEREFDLRLLHPEADYPLMPARQLAYWQSGTSFKGLANQARLHFTSIKRHGTSQRSIDDAKVARQGWATHLGLPLHLHKLFNEPEGSLSVDSSAGIILNCYPFLEAKPRSCTSKHFAVRAGEIASAALTRVESVENIQVSPVSPPLLHGLHFFSFNESPGHMSANWAAPNFKSLASASSASSRPSPSLLRSTPPSTISSPAMASAACPLPVDPSVFIGWDSTWIQVLQEVILADPNIGRLLRTLFPKEEISGAAMSLAESIAGKACKEAWVVTEKQSTAQPWNTLYASSHIGEITAGHASRASSMRQAVYAELKLLVNERLGEASSNHENNPLANSVYKNKILSSLLDVINLAFNLALASVFIERAQQLSPEKQAWSAQHPPLIMELHSLAAAVGKELAAFAGHTTEACELYAAELLAPLDTTKAEWNLPPESTSERGFLGKVRAALLLLPITVTKDLIKRDRAANEIVNHLLLPYEDMLEKPAPDSFVKLLNKLSYSTGVRVTLFRSSSAGDVVMRDTPLALALYRFCHHFAKAILHHRELTVCSLQLQKLFKKQLLGDPSHNLFFARFFLDKAIQQASADHSFLTDSGSEYLREEENSPCDNLSWIRHSATSGSNSGPMQKLMASEKSSSPTSDGRHHDLRAYSDQLSISEIFDRDPLPQLVGDDLHSPRAIVVVDCESSLSLIQASN